MIVSALSMIPWHRVFGLPDDAVTRQDIGIRDASAVRVGVPAVTAGKRDC
jgi:hypothetical protein